VTRLLVLLADRVSDWVAKGEVVDRYLNPGDVFDHVDVLLTNDDDPPADAVQRMAGRADVAVHNLPTPSWLLPVSVGWQPELLGWWTRRAEELAARLRPDLQRVHGVRLNALAASAVKRRLGIPYVVSVHTNHDTEDLRSPRSSAPRRVAGRLVQRLERRVLRDADLVLPVYESIVPYLRRLGVTRYEVAYNVVGHGVAPRTDWLLDGGVLRLVNVGRQVAGLKDPRPIIDAVAALTDATLHLVGDGPLHDELHAHAARVGATDRITFTRAMPNEHVLAELAAADAYAFQTSARELSKTCIEAALSGLPLVVNDHRGTVPELVGDHVLLVDGSAASYRDALALLLDDERREALGRRALDVATERWDPVRCEAIVADHYRALLAR
jgi:glycosyltransferase involved in cell wall biosynthesis